MLDAKVKERERIRQQELEFLREKASVLASQRKAMLLAKDEKVWGLRQDALLNAEEQRRAWYEENTWRMGDPMELLQLLLLFFLIQPRVLLHRHARNVENSL